MNLTGLTLGEFTRLLASDAPAPGGGSVAALAAALGASLCAMVARLTVGRQKYRDSWESMEKLRDTADELSTIFLELVEKDSDAYNLVTAALKLPKETDAQKESRRQAIESGTRQAAAVPMETLENLSRIPGLVREALMQGNPNCLTDAGVAVQLMRAAAAGAAYNVRINLSGIKDQELTGKLSARTGELLAQIRAEAATLEQMVEEKLGF
jgi:formiminotetrahydrofolate cyclodeaminase